MNLPGEALPSNKNNENTDKDNFSITINKQIKEILTNIDPKFSSDMYNQIKKNLKYLNP